MSKDESVSIVIFNEERSKVLLVKRRDIPVWVLPGGGVDPGELPDTAAQREAEEETGCRVLLLRKVAEYLPVNRFTKLTHLFEGKILSGTPSSNSEASEGAFFSVSTLPKLLSPPFADWIADAHANRSGLIRKEIRGVSYWVFLKLLILHPILVFRYLLTRCGLHLNKK